MAPAILTGLFILLLYSQDTCAQQGLSATNNLGFNSAAGLSQQTLQRSTSSNNLNQIASNPSTSFNLPQQSNTQQVQQQTFNLQQPTQNTNNLQQQSNLQLSSPPAANSQSVHQQYQFQNSENSFASLQNTKHSGLPSQGGTSSNPSIKPSSSLQITSCSFKPSVEPTSLTQSQNQHGTIFTIPATVINKSQTANYPSSISTSTVESSKSSPTFTFQTVSNPIQQNSYSPQQTMTQNFVPTPQQQVTDSQNQMVNIPQYYTQQQVLNSAQNQPSVTSVQGQSTALTTQIQPSLTFEQKLPAELSVQGQPALTSMQNQPAYYILQSQPSFTSGQNQPALATVQGQPVVTSVQSQPILTTIQSQPVIYTMGQSPARMPVEIQQSHPALNSLEDQTLSVLMSQLLSSSNPYGKASSFPNVVVETKQSKTSGLKGLLPIIFNLFKEKSSSCGCRNCGCMNNNNKSNQNVQEPQICGGYSNQRNYSQQHLNEDNSQKHIDDSEELVNTSGSCKGEPENYKNNINTDSTESSEEDDTEYSEDYDEED